MKNCHGTSRYLHYIAVVTASLSGCALSSGKAKFQAANVGSGPMTQLRVSDATETVNMDRYAE
ncbi:MAG: hypothetical protein ACK53L_33945, partial [Pirellulaceae bacterium]